MSELTVGTLSGLAANSYVIDVASGSQLTQPGMILQVVSTTKTDTFSASLGAGGISGDITGLTATLTPASSSNDVLISCSLTVSHDASGEALHVALYRDGTKIASASGTPEGSKSGATTSTTSPNQFTQMSISFDFLDSPATTSSVTYSVRLQNQENGTGVLYVNRAASEVDEARYARTVSTITAMEVAG